MDTTTKVLLAISLIAAVHHSPLRPLLRRPRAAVQPGPLTTQPAAQLATLAYPPDFFPGARDVPTPWGSLRCYEFGPRAARRRVLLVHGLATASAALAAVARGLAAGGGCRVLLLDLPGRGYSDGVGDLPHDARLLVAPLLCALAASGWTTTTTTTTTAAAAAGPAIDVLGYSLGGAVAVAFAAAFPALVRSVVLLAPAGVIRAQTWGAAPRLLFRSGWVPRALLEVLARWWLKRPLAAAARRTRTPTKAVAVAGPVMAGAKTAEGAVEEEEEEEAPPNELQKRVAALVRWQAEHHAGFVTAFVSTLRYGPLMDQHETWAKLAKRKPKTVLFVFGQGDEIVKEDEYREDVLPLVGGEEHVVWAEPVGGRHDFPMVNGEETVQRIYDFWHLQEASAHTEEECEDARLGPDHQH